MATVARPLLWIALLLVGAVVAFGCQPRAIALPEESTDDHGSTTLEGTGATESADTADATTFTDESSTGLALPGEGEACDLEVPLPHCAVGFKCMPYADGPSLAHGSICTALDPSPVSLGAPCEWRGAIFSGEDNCEEFAFCDDWGSEGTGTCKGLCEFTVPGDWETATCQSQFSVRQPACEGCFCACQPSTECSPLLLETCADGEVCVSSGPISFGCRADESGEGGAVGDTCEDFDECDYGNACLNSRVVGVCPGSVGCCAPFCRTDEPNECPGAAEGEECVSWWEAVDIPLPEAFAQLGVCMLPL